MIEDLDQLVLRCRDARARAYISEAVLAYKAGAYRACIVTTWIAAAFDIVDKIHELALAGDKEAEKLTDEYETIRQSGDVVAALRFEKKLLEVAHKNFELISTVERTDLERLQEDRNRCAHLSRTAEAEFFTPPAELARLHIRTAVEHLLQHEPAQGRAALDGIIREVTSPYFPTSEKDALAVLRKTPLNRARRSLVRNLLVVVLKALLREKLDYKQQWRFRSVIQGVKVLHLSTWRETMKSDLSPLLRSLMGAEQMAAIIEFAQVDEELWIYVEEDQRTRLRTFVEELPASHIHLLDELLSFKPLAPPAKKRVGRLTPADLRQAMFFIMPVEVAEHVVTEYVGSRDFDTANAWGKVVQELASDFGDRHVREIIAGAGANYEVSNSFQIAGVVSKFRAAERVPPQEFEELLRTSGLAQYARDA